MTSDARYEAGRRTEARLSVPCSYCGAGPGEHCRKSSGEPYTASEAHAARHVAAGQERTPTTLAE